MLDALAVRAEHFAADGGERVTAASAREFAIRAHGVQRYGAHPYRVHLDAVAELVPLEYRAVAYLHDVLEDTDAEVDDIERLFGSSVRQCVELLTDPSGPTRKHRKALLYERLSNVTPELEAALVVKAADRLANIRASVADGSTRLEMYRSEHTEVRSAVYRAELCEALWDEMERLLRP